ncbi:MAG: hypothetical protein KDD12_09055, partial [Lewinella sp.]|nr:hypothetical protein [Lewinella sp.]
MKFHRVPDFRCKSFANPSLSSNSLGQEYSKTCSRRKKQVVSSAQGIQMSDLCTSMSDLCNAVRLTFGTDTIYHMTGPVRGDRPNRNLMNCFTRTTLRTVPFRIFCQCCLLLSGILLTTHTAVAQTNLNDNGAGYEISYTGAYEDYLIPADAETGILSFFLQGADGGSRNSCTSNGKGGQGAEVETFFRVGTGDGDLQPG